MLRSMKNTMCIMSLIVGIGLLTAQAQAAVTYSYGFSSSNFNVAPGGTVDVDVYLIETITEGDTSLIVEDDGLYSAQVTVTRIAPEPTDPAIFIDAEANEAEFNAYYDPETDVFPIAPVTFTEEEVIIYETIDIAQFTGPMGEDLGGGIRRVLLGTLTIEAGLLADEVTTFEATDDPDFDETVTAGLVAPYNIDGDYGIAPASFTVTVIPEPASLALFGLGACALMGRRQRQ